MEEERNDNNKGEKSSTGWQGYLVRAIVVGTILISALFSGEKSQRADQFSMKKIPLFSTFRCRILLWCTVFAIQSGRKVVKTENTENTEKIVITSQPTLTAQRGAPAL